jgi:hypothetical protein
MQYSAEEDGDGGGDAEVLRCRAAHYAYRMAEKFENFPSFKQTG